MNYMSIAILLHKEYALLGQLNYVSDIYNMLLEEGEIVEVNSITRNDYHYVLFKRDTNGKYYLYRTSSNGINNDTLNNITTMGEHRLIEILNDERFPVNLRTVHSNELLTSNIGSVIYHL